MAEDFGEIDGMDVGSFIGIRVWVALSIEFILMGIDSAQSISSLKLRGFSKNLNPMEWN